MKSKTAPQAPSLAGASGDAMAGGALRAAAAALCLANGFLPPITGLETPDPSLPKLELLRGTSRAVRGPILLSAASDGGAFHALVLGPV